MYTETITDRHNRGSRIRMRREALGLSDGEVAEKIGVAQRTYENIEGGSGTTIEKYVRISQVLHVSLDYLILGEQSIPENSTIEIQTISDIVGQFDSDKQRALTRIMYQISGFNKNE